MANEKYFNRIMDYTPASWTGTGAIALAGTPPAGNFSFASVLSDGQAFFYEIENCSNATEIEVGRGIYNAAGPTITRDVVETSSNGGMLVNFTAGIKVVGLILPASVIRQICSAANVDASLISVVWGTPGSEVANTIEINATCLDFSGGSFASGLVDVEILVSDGAADNEPSATAAITAAGTPVGTLLRGSGTATVVMRTNSSGSFSIAVHEATASVMRYLWVKQGGHARLWVRSSAGVLELSFA